MIAQADISYNLRSNSPLKDIASSNVIHLAPDAKLSDAAAVMTQRRISSIVVMNDDAIPLGIVTETNVIAAMQSGLSPEATLREIMTAPVVTVPAGMSCLDGYQVCLRDGVRHMIVVDDQNKLVGLVSETDFRLQFNLAALTGRRQVATVMSRAVFSVSPESRLANAMAQMQAHHDTCVVVVDNQRPIGIVTERDIVRLFAHGTDHTDIAVRDVMSSPVLTVSLDANINQAAETMLGAKVRHLIVVDNDGLMVGMIAEHDLTNTMAGSLLDLKQLAEGAFLHTLVNALPDLVWLKDVGGVYLACNPRFESMFGAREEEIVGKTDYDFVPQSVAEAFLADDRRAMKVNEPTYIEEWVTFADGHCELLETIKTPMRDSHGQLIGVLGIARDITERKRVEAEIRIAATAFESQEGMIVTDAEGKILRVNKAFTATTGYAPEEVVGMNPSLLSSGRHDRAFYAAMWDSIRQHGSWAGEIWNRRKNGEIYPERLTITAVKDDQGHLANYVAAFSDITNSKAAAEEIERLAFYDPLTHLPNRRLLIDRLQQALASSTRNGSHGALLFLDLDHFKTLNDTLGHDIGDKLLQQVAERLNTCVREGDTVARLGGDEFVVMLEDMSPQALEAAAQAELIGAKILNRLNRAYRLGTHTYHSTPSIGITLFSDHIHSVDELLKQADIAMYQAKKAGRNTLSFFDPEMQETINLRAALENELREAIAHHQFELYYQIQMHSSGRVLGAEALVRWLHPQRGVVQPQEFIPLAEESGLILSLGQWVLEAACIELGNWRQNPLLSALTLSVNVSARQFHQANFVRQVKECVRRYGVNPARLKLELTESMLLDNTDGIIASMKELKALGIQFSLDDFGTGYSSLQYLKRLPLDQLKIDQNFVRDIVKDGNDEAIVRTIIAMAQSMELDFIAEGVETEEQKQVLLSYGCTHYQGYLFSKPVPLKAFQQLVREAVEK
ncbi:diguanylate cyclase [Novimethylophilus kurashikiensis]|uniref:Diguanylate cyclase n=1 Tax=Novimethylophilus kurashikiensis TaxID=1825523 RepID=A0A2R5FE38_9PROT|nr:EAL domain-containing protein [Novimethylophilus kurashikiensis]GBG15969.1 diguanylate cyclase [Novimethylophilus kurashikiensis]